MSQRWCKQRCFALGEKPRCQSSHVTSPLNELRKRPKGFLRVDFSLLIANFELLSMEIFFASRERFFSFIVFVAVLIFGFEQIIFSFTVLCNRENLFKSKEMLFLPLSLYSR